ncbi:MAG: hypothetical protein FJ221_09955 [Lentisphaerae bacterium]|nr:hypothetical protein [Lentisphaerota bacterium]
MNFKLVIIVVGLLAGQASATDMDRKLADSYQGHLAAVFRLQPLTATRLLISGRFSDGVGTRPALPA